MKKIFIFLTLFLIIGLTGCPFGNQTKIYCIISGDVMQEAVRDIAEDRPIEWIGIRFNVNFDFIEGNGEPNIQKYWQSLDDIKETEIFELTATELLLDYKAPCEVRMSITVGYADATEEERKRGKGSGKVYIIDERDFDSYKDPYDAPHWVSFESGKSQALKVWFKLDKDNPYKRLILHEDYDLEFIDNYIPE